MKLRTRTQRLLGLALVIALLGSLTLAGASGLAVVEQELLVNGGFEGGFVYAPGCGNVGAEWGCFTNGGSVDYGFYDDQWQPVVASGAHSQLIELSTVRHQATQADRYAGIYQTVKLVKGQKYQFQLKGLMRELNSKLYDDANGNLQRYEELWRDPRNNEGDAFRYRVQWGYTTDGAADWSKVSNWVELPWDKIDIRTSPTGFQSFSTTFTAPSDKITLFIRVWKKWATAYRDLEVNLDAISLFGLAVKEPVTPADPVVILPGPVTPAPVTPAVCGGKNYVANGDFEGGFTGGVGKGWTAFNNGGRAAYGFYDEAAGPNWTKVVKDGSHGQLIEINTIGLHPADSDRYAGIYQLVAGLTPGMTYEFSLAGMMRESIFNPYSTQTDDKYRYRVQWGFASAAPGANEKNIANWAELPWDTIYPRETPGDMASFSGKLVAPSQSILIGVRAWLKWGAPERELDVNLDAIKLTGCACPPDGCACTGVYTVVNGDTLSAIAAKYGASVEALAQKNNLAAPYTIYVGQKLSVPCDGGPVVIPPQDECIWVTVAAGDTVFGLALKYNSSVALIMERNKLANPNLIYVGQKLCIIDP
jgi:LysM repeat protein